MKTLILIRHGKSDWSVNVPDFERPLNKRGLRDAPTMASKLKQGGIVPDAFFVSTAKRTTQTAQLLCDKLNLPHELIVPCPELYLCHADDVLDTASCVPNDIDTLAIVAHNPALSYLAAQIVKQNFLDMPTLGILIATFNIDSWLDLQVEKMEAYTYLYPKMDQK